MEILLIFVFGMILGVIPGMIADKKGHSFVFWRFFGTLLFIIALPAALLLTDRNTKKCPQCAELVKLDALRCRHCGHDFTPLAARRSGLIKCPSCRRDVPATLTRCTFCHSSTS